MKLQGLAGGKMHPADLIVLNSLSDKPQLFLCYDASWHTQAQHTGLAAPLGVASKAAGNPLVGFGIHFSAVKLFRCFFKCLVVVFPDFWTDVCHFHVNDHPFIQIRVIRY